MRKYIYTFTFISLFVLPIVGCSLGVQHANNVKEVLRRVSSRLDDPNSIEMESFLKKIKTKKAFAILIYFEENINNFESLRKLKNFCSITRYRKVNIVSYRSLYNYNHKTVNFLPALEKYFKSCGCKSVYSDKRKFRKKQWHKNQNNEYAYPFIRSGAPAYVINTNGEDYELIEASNYPITRNKLIPYNLIVITIIS